MELDALYLPNSRDAKGKLRSRLPYQDEWTRNVGRVLCVSACAFAPNVATAHLLRHCSVLVLTARHESTPLEKLNRKLKASRLDYRRNLGWRKHTDIDGIGVTHALDRF